MAGDGEDVEYPEMNMKEVITALVTLANAGSSSEIRRLGELGRDMMFHVLHLEGEIEALEERLDWAKIPRELDWSEEPDEKQDGE